MLSCFRKYASPDQNSIVKSVIDTDEIRTPKTILNPEIPRQPSLYSNDKLCFFVHYIQYWSSNSKIYYLRSRLRIEVRPTENDLTRLYKNGDISVVITCS